MPGEADDRDHAVGPLNSVGFGEGDFPCGPRQPGNESEVAQSCPTLCDPIDGSPAGSPVLLAVKPTYGHRAVVKESAGLIAGHHTRSPTQLVLRKPEPSSQWGSARQF